MKYDHKKTEEKWAEVWKKENTYSPDMNSASEPFYNLMMFPYPSAEGLHAGNMFAFTGSDVFGRFQRMQGFDVFEPIGLDGFGIHSENFALKIGRTPSEHAKISEANYYKQLHKIGNGFDWNRTVETYDPEYYKWTQWLFIKMWEKGLAYKKKAPVNWCPSCKTVLADEQVMTPKQAGKDAKDANGKVVVNVEDDLTVCERCGTIVEKKDLEQWFFGITKYADRLLEDQKKIDWTKKVVLAQREWIGKKSGINISYDIIGVERKITVFTTAPVNFGMTFLALSPDHEVVTDILAGEVVVEPETLAKIKEYVEKYKSSKKDRNAQKDKTGVNTGLFVVNPINLAKVPVWVSDFVVSGVGTGALQGCPGHDLNDFDFAKKFGIPIIRVIVGEDGDAKEITTREQVIEKDQGGTFINSDFLNGMSFKDGLEKTMDYFEEKGWGERTNSYHLRDWLISRQRYWGPPIPMIFCEKCAWQAVPEKDLPVALPEITDFAPSGEGGGPLANHPEFFKTKCPKCGGEAKRETDVSDTFVDSAWYFLRYPSVGNSEVAFDAELTKKWLPVNLYFGGAEHSVLHLLYARFVTKVFFDLGYINFDEPFTKFYAHGLVIKDGAKMSKSRGNVVNPDEYIEKYGADTLRLYLMFMGPMDGTPDFRDSGIEGMNRFLGRLLSLFQDDTKRVDTKDLAGLTQVRNMVVKKVTEDIARFHYNTAISAIMELTGTMRKLGVDRDSQVVLCKLIAPFAPFLTEEIWESMGEKGSVHKSPWPVFDEKKIVSNSSLVSVQVNGKFRGTIDIGEDSKTQEEVETLAKADPRIGRWLLDKKILDVVYVPRKVLNFVLE